MGIKPPFVPPPPKPPGGGGNTPKAPSGGTHVPSGGTHVAASDTVAGLTATQRKSIIDNVTAAWRIFVKMPGGTPPKALIEAALKTRGMDNATMKEWVRTETPKTYLRTEVAAARKLEVARMLNAAFGVDLKPDDKTLDKLKLAYILADPGKGDFKVFFQKNIRALLPGFNAWFAKAQGDKPYATAFDALGDFYAARTQYKNWYQQVMGTAAPIPDELLNRAMAGNYTDAEFQADVRNSSEWATSPGAVSRDEDFLRNWDSVFAGTQWATPPADMLDKFRKGTSTWETFLETDVKDSPSFNSAFPDYQKWESNMHTQGYGEDKTNINSFLNLRAGFVTTYRELMGDNSATPPPDLLSQALMGNWSDTMWTNQIKAADPKYTGTADYKNRTASFDWYWKSVMGEQTPVNTSLAHQYAAGGYSDPQALFDQIQATPEFAAQYPDWATFSAAQTNAGNNAVMDPLQYKAYATGFDKALANAGLAVDPGFKHNFFASGLNPTEFANNVEQYVQQKESYAWQTGEQADMQTAAGVTDKTAGGDLRKRLQEALNQHQAFAQSKFQQFNTGQTAGGVVKNI